MTKDEFRVESLEKLRDIKKFNRYYIDAKINAKLLSEFKNLKNLRVLLYYPLQNEVNIKKTINTLRKKHQVYVPFMEGNSFKMVSFRLPLKEKRFGIYESGNSLKKIKNIDIAVVPIVGVDKNFKRVGFGKGMYDRFFPTLNKRPYTIFIQRELCKTELSICDDYDIWCDKLLSGSRTLVNKRK